MPPGPARRHGRPIGLASGDDPTKEHALRPIEPFTLDDAPDDVRTLMEPWKDGLVVIGGSEKDGQFTGLLAHRPELMETVLNHYGTFLTSGTLSVRLKELVRLVTADAIRCSS
jgi:hypothetical protein